MYAKHVLFPRRTPRTTIVAEGKMLPSLTELRQMVFTFASITVPCIFFRAESMEQGMDFIRGIVSMSLFELPSVYPEVSLIVLMVMFGAIEWIGRHHWSPLTFFQKYPFWVQWSVYQIVIALTWYCRALEKSDFIYFQF
jgi:hypothetical protein